MPVLDNGEYRLPMLDSSKPHETVNVWKGIGLNVRASVKVMTREFMKSQAEHADDKHVNPSDIGG